MSATAPSSGYAYNELDQGCFRILSIAGSTPSKLIASLKTATLADVPEYFTLSYSWNVGPSRPKVKLEIDGQTLMVTAALYDALLRLSGFDGGGFEPESTGADHNVPPWNPSTSWIWIDQICINQEDDKEKVKQVGMMGSIYSSAVRTIIWLGPVEKNCGKAWDLVQQIYDVSRRDNPDAKYLADIAFQMYSPQRHNELGFPPFSDNIWEHFRVLFGAAWFTRIWVVQEAVLSQHDPIMLHGPLVHSWERLSWVAMWLRRNGYHRLSEVPTSLATVDTISNIRGTKRWRLNSLLFTTSIKFHSTDSRDKVYGLLGMSAEYQDRSNIPAILEPNYKMDPAMVYASVVRHIIQSSGNLAVFTRVGIYKDTDFRQSRGIIRQGNKVGPSFPSWVPNWDDVSGVWENSITRSGLAWAFYRNDGEAPHLGFLPKYRASEDLTPELLDGDGFNDPNVLRIGGLVADTIEEAIPWDDGYGEEPVILRCWKMATRLTGFKDIAEFVTAFIKATTAEQYDIGGKKEVHLHQDGAAYLLSMFQKIEMDSMEQQLREFGWPIHQIVAELRRLSDDKAHEDDYSGLAKNYCSPRTFFVTSQRRCMGIGPRPTSNKDIVSVLFGGGVPYILRSADRQGTFHLVGESYILGLMDGQIIREWRSGKIERQIFDLE